MSQRSKQWRRMREAVAAASIPLAAVVFLASPAQAEPAGPTAVPAGGATPVLSDLFVPPIPPTAAAPATDAISPLASEIINAQNTTERLGEQLKGVGHELSAAQAVTAPIRARWAKADAALTALKDQIAAQQAASPSAPPSPGPSPSPSSSPTSSAPPAPAADAAPGAPQHAAVPGEDDALAARLADAQRAEADAKSDLDASVLVENEISGRYGVLNEQFQRAQSALGVLKARNADQIAAVDSARDTFESAQAAARNVSSAVNGMAAGAAAQHAVAFALSQIGKPYAWAEEGPDSFDCSGLTYASYLSVGIRLPRVAVDQYLHGPGQYVPVSQLLPGDLLFFSTDHADPTKIHHVAMYIGGGLMVHAPTFGEHVKVAPVWWTEYYGAMRLVPAVAGPGATAAAPAQPAQPAPTQPATTQPASTESTGPTTAPAPAPTTTSPSEPPSDSPPATTPSDSPTPTPDPTTPAPVATTTPPTATPAPPAPTTQTSTPPATTTPSSTPAPTPDPTPSPTPSPISGAVFVILGTGSLALTRPERKPAP